jgi:hypothetical protein
LGMFLLHFQIFCNRRQSPIIYSLGDCLRFNRDGFLSSIRTVKI